MGATSEFTPAAVVRSAGAFWYPCPVSWLAVIRSCGESLKIGGIMRSEKDNGAGAGAVGGSPGVAGAVLEVRDLWAGYCDLAAVRGVSFALVPGEVLAFLGEVTP